MKQNSESRPFFSFPLFFIASFLGGSAKSPPRFCLPLVFFFSKNRSDPSTAPEWVNGSSHVAAARCVSGDAVASDPDSASCRAAADPQSRAILGIG